MPMAPAKILHIQQFRRQYTAILKGLSGENVLIMTTNQIIVVYFDVVK
jgi:hypothetical protein